MKINLSKILIGLCLGVSLTSCQKELEDQFKNPEKSNPPLDQKWSGMFTATLYGWKLYVGDYGEWYWMLNSGTGIPGYAQISQRYITSRYSWFNTYDDLKTGNGFSDSGINDFFNSFYKNTRNYGEMRDMVATAPADQKNEAMFYLKLTTVVRDFGALKLIDLVNNVPFTQAWQGAAGVFFPQYDDAQKTTESILGELKSIADTLPTLYNNLSVAGKSDFVKQDFAAKGDVNMWIQYISMLRIRYAVRIAGVNTTLAKQILTEELAKPRPTKDIVWQMPFTADPLSGGTWERGWYENAFAGFVPNTILKRMNFGTNAYEPGIDDPRLPVIAMPTKFNDYRGVSYNSDAQDAPYAAGEKYYPYADDLPSSLAQNAKSMYNHATYCRNTMPGNWMTLGELDLLLAEIELKGLGATGKTPGEHIQNAVIHSTAYWYWVNGLSAYQKNTVLHPAAPDAATVATYATVVRTKFEAASTVEDKMEILMQQKYIHLNLPGTMELFAELRRTRHPKLEPFTFGGKAMKPVAERIRYPNSELQTNTDNYLKVKAQDNYITPIFWVPADKRAESYYRDDYNY
ncbi:SusD-like starch-binding protein associating with outer membrane [Chitinophaga dinghuensis]|uniref:SusD-like starch-binding protein associating with outer membrane n=1 Tax=Chitinophaga dinghuensis TaxID=1539050 RepID=A0A327WC02_9BACT|nr:SusD/RagB family nutrient-binding outer membrane lipoprotein [Chitinophaga dinghuensis]RAJ87719.1 SusD-like starch-binding protein associating with outer membrane [Chitinophaga dinghuensis]